MPTPSPQAAQAPTPQRHQMLQAGLDLIDQGITVFDADLKMVAWNRSFLKLLEFPDHLAYLGAPFESFMRYNALRGEYGAGDPEAHIASRVAAAKAFIPHDLIRERPDGRVLRVVGQPLPGHGFVTLYSDITEQRRAERTIRQQNAELERRVIERTAELHRSEQQMRLITDSIPALVGYVDRTRTYRYVNRGYGEWFGLDTSKPGAISARAFLGADTYNGIKDHIWRAFSGESVSFVYDLTRIDGSRLRVRTSLIPDFGADGEVAGCFELTFDLTEHHRAQELVMKAQKMEALGQLTGGLAHDFNNLLTVIIGNLGLLAEQQRDAESTREFVEPALQAARRGAELIKRLMLFARQQPLKAASVDAAQALGDVAKLVRRSMPETLDIAVKGGREPLWTWIDPFELETALLNLLLNARDATGGKGRIDLHARAVELLPDAAGARRLAPGRYVRIDVTDNGCGMDAATLERLFEPFFTTKPVGVGTGLGMAMVYGFVSQSGGAVEADSTPGRGTTISLWLPAADAPDELAGIDTDSALLSGASNGVDGQPRPSLEATALLVEDDEAVRQVVRHTLLDLGYAVLEAESGQEALDMLRQGVPVDLLLTDIVMPGGVDGRDLAHEALDRYRIAKVLLMSGHAPERQTTDDARADLTILPKPFSPAQLARALQSAATPAAATLDGQP